MLFFMPVIIEFSRCIGTYSSAKFEFNKVSDLQKQIQDMLNKAISQEKLNTKMQLEKLRAQTNPHFLLNTLNTLHWMALMNEQAEMDAITQSLSRLLSYNLDKDSSHSNLTKELDATTEYVLLQKVRYDFDFIVNTFCEKSSLNYPCPKFIIQPLVENSLLHGYKKDMQINVDIVVNDFIRILISDTGTGIDSKTLKMLQEMSPVSNLALPDAANEISFGIGIQYVIQSLNDYYNGEYNFFVNSSYGKGTEILLLIPKIKGGGYNDQNIDR